MRNLNQLFAALLLGAGTAAASGINGPVSGFMLDARSRALRPVNGLPGAAVMGAPLAIPFQVQLAAVAPRRDFALAAGFDDNAQVVLVSGLSAAAPAVSSIAGVIGGVTRIALSAGGSAALLYSASSAQLQTLSGLPDNPRAGAAIDVSGLGDAITALAVDDTGAVLVVGTGSQDAGAVYLIPADGAAARLAPAHNVSALVLLNGARDVAFASNTSNEIVRVSNIAGTISAQIVGSANDGVSNPVGLAAAKGDSELWVANAGSSSLLVFNLAQPGPPESIDLPSAPTRCDVLNGRSMLVLNDVGQAPLLLLDPEADRAVYFVPVD